MYIYIYIRDRISAESSLSGDVSYIYTSRAAGFFSYRAWAHPLSRSVRALAMVLGCDFLSECSGKREADWIWLSSLGVGGCAREKERESKKMMLGNCCRELLPTCLYIGTGFIWSRSSMTKDKLFCFDFAWCFCRRGARLYWWGCLPLMCDKLTFFCLFLILCFSLARL